MPTVTQLERIQALVGRLTPLADAQQGELIRAQDWNTVVSVLIEVAQAVLEEGAADAVAPHEHPDQVTTGWLAPPVRSMIARGPLADPAGVARLNEVERRAERLANRLDDVGGDVKDVRTNLFEVATRDLTRQAQVTSVQQAVGGLADAREDVRQLRESLDSIKVEVRTAVDASAKLTIDGQPADLDALVARIKGVEELRERLQTPTGELLDARALEARLTQFTNTLVTQEQLTAALRNRVTELAPDQLDAIRDRVSVGLRNDFEASQARFGEQVRADVAASLAGVEAAVTREVATIRPDLEASVLGKIRPEIKTAVDQADAASQARSDARLSQATTAVRQDLGVQIQAVQASITPAVSAEIGRQLPQQLGSIRQDVAALDTRTTRVEGRVSNHDAVLQGVDTRLTDIARQDTDARATLQQTLLQEISRQTSQILQRTDQRFTALEGSITDQINRSVANLRPDLLREVRQVATDTVTLTTPNLLTQLRGEMHTVARDELTGTQDRLRQELQTLIATQVNTQIERVRPVRNPLIISPLNEGFSPP